MHSPLIVCKHTVSGTLSLASSACFSPFPHGTASLSVAEKFLALRDGPRGFPRAFTDPVVLGYHTTKPPQCRLRDYHPVSSPLPERFGYRGQVSVQGSETPRHMAPQHQCGNAFRLLRQHWFRLFPFRSPLLRESNFFLFLRVLRWFSSPGSHYWTYELGPEHHITIIW